MTVPTFVQTHEEEIRAIVRDELKKILGEKVGDATKVAISTVTKMVAAGMKQGTEATKHPRRY